MWRLFLRLRDGRVVGPESVSVHLSRPDVLGPRQVAKGQVRGKAHSFAINTAREERWSRTKSLLRGSVTLIVRTRPPDLVCHECRRQPFAVDSATPAQALCRRRSSLS